MKDKTPFDEARKKCSEFAWNFLSSIQMLKIKQKLDTIEETEETQTMFDTLVETHCKHLTNEVQQ